MYVVVCVHLCMWVCVCVCVCVDMWVYGCIRVHVCMTFCKIHCVWGEYTCTYMQCQIRIECKFPVNYSTCTY